ncbi:hypothetical protein [Streptomyces xantholiticus]|uniref:Uncharacterized protein n=1 Tax=Streptomyces xantholiticus TaxID=68285 RepID=A0ABV1UX08_9ACTN
MNRRAHPSRWARQRFGAHAAGLVATGPERLARAHLPARTAHDMAELKKRGPYGHVLAETVREELALEAISLGGAVCEEPTRFVAAPGF